MEPATLIALAALAFVVLRGNGGAAVPPPPVPSSSQAKTGDWLEGAVGIGCIAAASYYGTPAAGKLAAPICTSSTVTKPAAAGVRASVKPWTSGTKDVLNSVKSGNVVGVVKGSAELAVAPFTSSYGGAKAAVVGVKDALKRWL